MKTKWTEKQIKFVQEYLVDLNATGAATRAGYSAKTAYSIGFELLRKPEIQEAIQVARQELAAKIGITPEKVVNGFADGSFYDISDFYDEENNLKSIHDIPKRARNAITGIEVEEIFQGGEAGKVYVGRVKKVKLCSRHQNLDSLAKHFGLYNADNTNKTPVEIVIRDLRAERTSKD